MDIKIVGTSLNLNVEKKIGKVNRDYLLSRNVAEEQLKLEADIYCGDIMLEEELIGYNEIVEGVLSDWFPSATTEEELEYEMECWNWYD